jgi:hypothetical protein
MLLMSPLLLLLLQAEMYEGAHNISKLVELGPVPGVKTYCIYGEPWVQTRWTSSSSSSSRSCSSMHGFVVWHMRGECSGHDRRLKFVVILL